MSPTLKMLVKIDRFRMFPPTKNFLQPKKYADSEWFLSTQMQMWLEVTSLPRRYVLKPQMNISTDLAHNPLFKHTAVVSPDPWRCRHSQVFSVAFW